MALLTASTYGQVFPIKEPLTAGTRLLYLHYQNSGGEKGVTTFQYDADGKNEIALWNLLDGTRNSFNEYVYDDSGRISGIHRLFSDGMTSFEEFKYNDKGNVTNVAFQRSDGITGTAKLLYDDQGRCVKAVCDKHKGWMTADFEFTYDDQGRRLSAIITRDGKTLGQVTYSYFPDGNMKQQHWDFGGQWTQTFDYEYEDCDKLPDSYYTSCNPFIPGGSGFRVSGEGYTYNGKSGGPSYYKYDNLGRLASKKFVRDDGLSTENKFFYNAKGNPTKAVRTYSDGKSAIISYEFDDNGRMVSRMLNRSDSVSTGETFQYDNDGRMVSAVYDNMDGWLTGTMDFEHYDDGRIKKGHFKAKNATADIDFEYDDNNNLTSLTWNFSFGEYQKYTFEYEKES